jgi:hypothetical protein
MLGRDWALLVTGTLLGVVSLTADLLGIGAFAGFGWKQTIGTAAALACLPGLAHLPRFPARRP